MNGYHLAESQNNNVWVIGNGESRKDIDLNFISGTTIGCNAIHRDHVCNYIVAVDRRMVREILSNPEYIDIPIYTRSNWVNEFKKFPNVCAVPELPYEGKSRWDDPWHWNSGPFAVLLACLSNPKTVNLIGFDLYGLNGKVNNIYKNSKNYNSENYHSVDCSHWLHQLKKLFDFYSKINFVQWQKENWEIPKDWSTSKNLTFSSLKV